MTTCGTAAAVVGAGVGVAGLLGAGGGDNQGTTSTGSSVPQVPSWLLPSLQANATTATNLAAQPYQPYTGQQVAPTNALQGQAASLAQSLPGQAQAGFQQANAIQTNVANQGQNGLNPALIQSYMNPYTQQVMDASQQRQLQQLQLEQNQLGAQQGQIGAFGGSRAALAQGQLASNFEQQLSQNQASQLQTGYNNAVSSAQTGLGQANTAAQGIMTGAAGTQTAAMQNIGALSNVGGVQQTTDQQGLNAQYQNYLAQQAYPYQNLANSTNVLGQINNMVTGTNTTGAQINTGSPGMLQTGLGLATAGSAFLKAENNSNGSGNNAFNNVSLGFGNMLSGNPWGGGISANGMGSNADAAWSSAEGLMNGGMVPHSIAGYAQGGQVHAGIPSLRDNISNFISSLASHYDAGGLVQPGREGYGYAHGGLVNENKAGIPGIPVKYGYDEGSVPYTKQQGLGYETPAYKAGGQVSGLLSADIGGIKRERQHYGQPFVKQDPAAQGYLRPNIKNAFAYGGLVQHYENAGLVEANNAAAIGDDPYAQPLSLSDVNNFLPAAQANLPQSSDRIVTQPPSLSAPGPVQAKVNTPAPGEHGYLDNVWSDLKKGWPFVQDTPAEPIAYKDISPYNSPLGNAGAMIQNAGIGTLHGFVNTINAPRDAAEWLTTPSRTPAMDIAQAKMASVKDRAKADQAKIDAYQAEQKTTSDQTSSTAIADQLKAQYAEPHNAEKTGMVNGVNIPLLAMGAGILGNRDNNLFSAIGAGGKAYVSAAEEQQKASIENMLKQQQAQYYAQRGNSIQERTPGMIAHMNAQTLREQAMSSGKPFNSQQAELALMKADPQYSIDPQGAAQRARDAVAATNPQQMANQAAQATPSIPEGATATAADGHQITFRNGQWQ